MSGCLDKYLSKILAGLVMIPLLSALSLVAGSVDGGHLLVGEDPYSKTCCGSVARRWLGQDLVCSYFRCRSPKYFLLTGPSSGWYLLVRSVLVQNLLLRVVLAGSDRRAC